MSRIRIVAVWTLDKEFSLEVPHGVKIARGNPRIFDGVVKNSHDAVYAPDYPRIEAAYKAAGKVIYRPEAEGKVEEEKPSEAPVESVEVVVEDEVAETPWRELPWPLMRSKATEFTDEPIKNKDMAIEVLEKAEQEGKI